MNLVELALKYQTDKQTDHNYMTFYEQHLPHDPKCILEIGVKSGASIRMWKEAYPNARIIGLDLFLEFQQPDIEGVEWIKGSQTNDVILYDIRHHIKPDVIIDDGSHNSRDQMVTFFSLFRKGCHYFIEDTECCREPFYQQELPYHLTADYLLFNQPAYTKVYSATGIIYITC